MRHFDLVIIGSGSGNSILDDRFADWNVAIVEKGVGSTGNYGGTCLNVGCIPTKMFVHTADVAGAPSSGTRLGVDLELRDVRWHDIRDRIFGRIDEISAGGRRYRAEDNPNVTLFEGVGRFTDVKRLEVETAGGTETITADRFVVAAGGRPAIPDIPGIENVDYHTSDSVMRLDELPRRMIIMGTGFVGAEFAHVFSALGVEVTLVGRSGRALRSQDVDVSERFTELAGRRWDLRLNRKEIGVEQDGDLTRLYLEGPDGSEVVEAEALLIAVGRVPNSDVLDAAKGGLALSRNGKIEVDSEQRTSVDGVWALGDISSPYELKHVANHEMRVVQHNLLHPDAPIESDHRYVPAAVFSSPQIASVGLTEQEAQQLGVEYVTSVQDYGGIAYGWAMEDSTGFAKLLADPETGKLLGAHIIGPQAPTLLQPLIQAMQFGLDARTMARGQYWIHPGMPELIENALLNLPLR
ncbi:mycothione reductase [Saccharopolyspora erythraea NRRL 2338]|uniref:Glutathione reductase n=2 Tax=Saccharopolyspora erythraea TaxID=1836 RepID=A4FM83_SACEN|nr:mycothione reductase [Saccharopolyspora erythraea]EQD87749.1 mycothione reductase [Saccharopolyspora erythraea D]PFG98795.1 mycothione reductase [Saccharopolyspora erythraea NRRL 2338]QRK93913.1 mycothione reductase [Saccharopolyspora erythraea]CAM05158.1 glutathione reductase [Saccharopolyspora erythraea NRRL 2338]